MKCSNCDHPQKKSDKRHFNIQKRFLPEEARRMNLSNLNLHCCDNCGLIEVHHKHQGYQGTYAVLLDRFWHGQFRRGKVETQQQAERLYESGGYAEFLPRGPFVRDFTFQKKRWSDYKGPKPAETNPAQNVLFS